MFCHTFRRQRAIFSPGWLAYKFEKTFDYEPSVQSKVFLIDDDLSLLMESVDRID